MGKTRVSVTWYDREAGYVARLDEDHSIRGRAHGGRDGRTAAVASLMMHLKTLGKSNREEDYDIHRTLI